MTIQMAGKKTKPLEITREITRNLSQNLTTSLTMVKKANLLNPRPNRCQQLLLHLPMMTGTPGSIWKSFLCEIS